MTTSKFKVQIFVKNHGCILVYTIRKANKQQNRLALFYLHCENFKITAVRFLVGNAVWQCGSHVTT